MTKLSKKVINWRKNTKRRLVMAFGDKCCSCEKIYPDEVMEFHHINPDEKEFSFASIRGNPRAWKILVIEMRKCIMLCANCHRLIHYEYKEIPEKPIIFNEKYAVYTSTQGRTIGI